MAQYRKKREGVSFSDIFKSESTLKREASLRKAKTEKKRAVNDSGALLDRHPPVPLSPTPASPTYKPPLTEAAIEAYLAKERQRQTAEREAAAKADIYRAQAGKATDEKAARDKEVEQRITKLIDRYFAYKAVHDNFGEQKTEVRQIADQLAHFGINVDLIAQRRDSLETHTGRGTTSVPSATASASFIWTKRSDKHLQQLKQDGKTWQEIADGLDRPIFEVKSRWRKLHKDAEESDRKAFNDDTGLDESYYFTTDVDNDRRKGKEPAKTKLRPSVQEEDSSDSSVDESRKYRRSNKSRRRVSFADPPEEKPELKPSWDRATDESPDPAVKPSCVNPAHRHRHLNSGLSFREVLLLHKLADQYDKEKWLRISSRFFDKTGKRIAPNYARERIEKDLAGGPEVW